MEQFHRGLRNDVNNLHLTFHDDPKSLTEAISGAVRCDNPLVERRSERQRMLRFRPERPNFDRNRDNTMPRAIS